MKDMIMNRYGIVYNVILHVLIVMEKIFGNVTNVMENNYCIMENVEIFARYIIMLLGTIVWNVMKNANIAMDPQIKNVILAMHITTS